MGMTEETENKILRKHLAKFIVTDVFNLITDEDILTQITVKPGQQVWTHKGRQLTKEQMQNLQSAAKSLLGSDLWKILKAEMKYQSVKKGFTDAVNETDMLQGKLLSWIVDVIQTKLDNMAKNKIV